MGSQITRHIKTTTVFAFGCYFKARVFFSENVEFLFTITNGRGISWWILAHFIRYCNAWHNVQYLSKCLNEHPCMLQRKSKMLNKFNSKMSMQTEVTLEQPVLVLAYCGFMILLCLLSACTLTVRVIVTWTKTLRNAMTLQRRRHNRHRQWVQTTECLLGRCLTIKHRNLTNSLSPQVSYRHHIEFIIIINWPALMWGPAIVMVCVVWPFVRPSVCHTRISLFCV